jgi:protein O-mannosyl-transferase
MSQLKNNNPVAPFFLRGYMVYFVFILISFLYYGNSMNNGFAMDDELATSTDRQQHPVVSKGWNGIPDAFVSHYAQDGSQKYAYRPITTVSFAVEYALFKESPNRARISHFVSVLLHGLCGVLLFILLQTLFFDKGKWFSFFVVLLFLVHPIHSEVVNNIKTRDELLAFLFGISSVISVLRYIDTRKAYWLVAAPFFLALAMLSKESGNVFVAVIPLCLFFFRDFSFKKILIWTVGFGLIYLAIRKVSMNMVSVDTIRIFHFFENPLYELGIVDRFPMFFYSMFLYLLLLFFPYPLRFYYGYDQIPIVNFSDWQFVVAFLVVAGLLWVAFRGLKSRDVVSFGIVFFFVAIGGAANLLFPIPGIIGERLAFIASAGFAIALVGITFRLLSWEVLRDELTSKMRLVLIGLAVVVLPTFFYSFKRNQDWDSALTLYRADIGHLSKSMKAHSLLATEYASMAFSLQRGGNMDDYPDVQSYGDSALTHYYKALAIYPGYSNTYNNISVLHFNVKSDVKNSIDFLQRALELDSTYSEAWFNLANSHGKIYKNFNEMLPFLGIDSSRLRLGSSIDNKEYVLLLDNLFEKGILKSWEYLNLIENAFSVYAKPLNTSIVNSFFRFADNVSNAEGRFLVEMNLSKELNRASQSSFDIQRNHIRKVIHAARKKLIDQITAISGKEQVVDFLLKGLDFHSRLVYDSYDKLYLVDSKYGLQYSYASTFAAAEKNYDQLMRWGRRLAQAYPEQAHQAYSQIGFVHRELGHVDSAIFYFEQSLLEKDELIRSLGKPETEAERNQKSQIRQELVRVQQVLGELKGID